MAAALEPVNQRPMDLSSYPYHRNLDKAQAWRSRLLRNTGFNRTWLFPIIPLSVQARRLPNLPVLRRYSGRCGACVLPVPTVPHSTGDADRRTGRNTDTRKSSGVHARVRDKMECSVHFRQKHVRRAETPGTGKKAKPRKATKRHGERIT